MPIESSKDKRRPQTPRVNELTAPVPSVESAPVRDPHTGRFLAGNDAYRRRQAKALARADLVGLNPAKCVPWLRPFAELAVRQATDLVQELPKGARTSCLEQLACDTATAQAVYRGLLALGATGDMKALTEARGWLREHRQNVITLTELSRQEAAAAGERDAPIDVEAANRRAEEATQRRRLGEPTC